jgi:hypothetical protein
MDFYVYLHKKKTTGEVFYVGKGTGKRAYHKTKRSKFWKNIVDKHGYIVEFVEVGLQEWYAFELEQNLISYYGRRDLEEGCLVNATEGGEGSSGHIWTEEMKEWRSLKTKEQFSSAEMRKKASDAKKGKKLSQKAKEQSVKVLNQYREKAKKAVSEMLKEKWKTPEFREKMLKQSKSLVMSESAKQKIAAALSKPVMRSDGVLFKSVSDAARSLGKQGSKITMVANGKRNMAYGYSWKYVQ